MKKSIVIYLIIIFYSSSIYAQLGFQKTYGTGHAAATAMERTSDGGYILTGGVVNVGAGKADVYLIKTDSNGNLAWTRSFGGAEYDYGWGVIQNMEGGYVSVGGSMSFGLTKAVYLVKTDNNGNLLTSRTYGNYQSATANAILQTSDSGYVIYGSCFDNIYRSLLIRTDKNGDTLWTKTYANKSGGSMIKTNYGGFVLCGRDQDGGNIDIFVTKTDNFGVPIWSRSLGIDSAITRCTKINKTSDGGYIIIGYSNKSNNTDVLLIKLDSLANIHWAKTYGGSDPDNGCDVKQTSDGGYIVSGLTNSFGNIYGDAYLIKTDSNGNLLWSKTYGDIYKESGYSVIQTSSGNYVIAGGTGISGGMYLIKTDSVGHVGCYENNPSTIVNIPTTHSSIGTNYISHCNATSTPSTVVDSGGVEYLLCTYSIDEMYNSQSTYTLYPNPTSEKVTVDLGKTYKTIYVSVKNIMGQEVLSKTYKTTNQLSFEIKGSSGVYFVEIRTDEGLPAETLVKAGKSAVFKVVKE